ncbi:GerAB/ArcD/ProY family transporter [Metabacillus idriensis]|uniref:GerAB/ArcD/ProY family transporter n=1 Tax=Metabacillus idriensis TaxID=324768 RepID=UPI003D2DB76D
MQIPSITSNQLLFTIFIFEIGSAILLDAAKGARQDAWIAILLGFTAAIPLILLYLSLYRKNPKLTLTGLLMKGFGKKIGLLLCFAYMIYFLYISARVLRDFGELLIISAYKDTSMIVINSFMILCVIYFSLKSFQVVAKLGVLLFVLIIVPFFVIIMFEILSQLVHVEYVKPILGNGWGPVLKTIFPTILTFPFGEMVVFLMIFPLLDEKKKALKVTFTALIMATFVLMTTAFLHAAILGADMVERSMFPILTTVSLVSISDFIERLDAFVVILMIVTGFMKVYIFFYGATRMAEEASGVKIKQISVVFGIFVILLAVLMAPDYIEHIKEGIEVVPYFLHIPFQIVLPVLLFLSLAVKSYLEKQRKMPLKQ